MFAFMSLPDMTFCGAHYPNKPLTFKIFELNYGKAISVIFITS